MDSYGDGDYLTMRAIRAPSRAAPGRACGEARPSVIHAHDWQTGLVPAYRRWVFVGPGRRRRLLCSRFTPGISGPLPAPTVESIGLG